MTHILKVINTWLKAEIANLPDITNDVFVSPETDSIICRHDPATYKVNEFIDGSSEGVCNFSYYARFSNAQTAREWLSTILDTLDNARIEATVQSQAYVLKTRSVSAPQFLECDDKGYSVYLCTAKAEFYRH